MRARGATAVAVVGALLAVSLVGPLAGTARAETLPPPKLYMTVWATTSGGRLVFEPSTITLGQVPTIVNLTVKNVDPTGMQHTFTIRTTTGTSDYIVDTGYLAPGQQTTVEFEVFAADRYRQVARRTRRRRPSTAPTPPTRTPVRWPMWTTRSVPCSTWYAAGRARRRSS